MLYFDKYRATATSCKYVGWAASGLAGPLVLSAAVANYGLGGSLLISAGIGLNALPLDMFLRRPRPLVLKFPCCRSRNLPSENDKTANALTRKMSDAVGPREYLNTGTVDWVSKWKSNLYAQAQNIVLTDTSCGDKTSSYVKRESETSQTSPQVMSTTSLRRTFDGNGESLNMNGDYGSNCHRSSMGVPYRKTASTERQPSPSKSSKSILEQLTIFRMLAFYVLLIVYALCDCTISMHTTTIVDYGRDKGSALEKAKLLLTYNAAGQFVGRTLLPFASDNVANSRCPFAVACFIGAGAWLALMPVVQSLTAFVALNLVLGVCQGYVTCIRSVLVNDYCGVERLPTFFGILGLALVPLSFSGPTIIGFFRDTLGSYDNFYRMLGAVNIGIAALLFVLVWRDKMRRKSRDLPTNSPGK
ncbi:hypothetical protein HPB52_016327 [Rhipicephalus sanguineus]|uniref:Monocarboxylate transporter n=2 Tax=Rhipicephalus sanguineus TaxID=34632 RepID=A0A9D4PX32_RHISA|nr:hypothetical protein HPB52_016327 [Rhipicephalus sanguineus]